MRMVPRHVRLVTVVIAAAGAVACSDSPTAPGHGSRISADLTSGGAHRNVIIMKDGATTMAALTAQVQSLGGQIVRTQPDISVVTVSGLSDAAAAVIANRSDVDGVQQDSAIAMLPPREQMIGQPITAQTDQSGAFFFPAFQWNMRQIKADKAWLVTSQGKGALVCVLDTGIDPHHIDLQGKIDLGISTSFVATEPDIIDHNFHGTFVSTLISSNGLGIASVAPDAELCMIKVLNANGQGNFSDLIAGIMYAAHQKADVINMSLGAYITIQTKADVQLVVALQRAISFAIHHGVVPVAAAGNNAVNLATDDPRNISIPAQLLGVIDVGATAPVNQMNFDQIASYSNVGFPGVLVFAPGGDLVAGGVVPDLILSACAGSAVPSCAGENSYVFGAGTSFASPHVAGEAAVIGSDFKHDPKVDKIEACITLTSDHPTGRFIDPLYGFGRIDVLNAAICMKH
ncbi:MAG TPA: S8 family serine peptidase [Gemmatimonadaceae bacterium]